MKECLQCNKELQGKRETAKFCSDNCRVKWNRKNGNKKGEIKHFQMQVLYNQIIEVLSKFNTQPTHVITPIAAANEIKTENINQFTEAIDKFTFYKDNITYSDSRQELVNSVNAMRKERFLNSKQKFELEAYAKQVLEKKGFIYND